MAERVKWPTKIVWFLRGRWEFSWLGRRLPEPTRDKISYWLDEHVVDHVARVLCRLTGHIPTVDHCGMPEHDYCEGCQKLMPGMADRTGIEQRWAAYAEKYGRDPTCPYIYREGRWWSRGSFAKHVEEDS